MHTLSPFLLFLETHTKKKNSFKKLYWPVLFISRLFTAFNLPSCCSESVVNVWRQKRGLEVAVLGEQTTYLWGKFSGIELGVGYQFLRLFAFCWFFVWQYWQYSVTNVLNIFKIWIFPNLEYFTKPSFYLRNILWNIQLINFQANTFSEKSTIAKVIDL